MTIWNVWLAVSLKPKNISVEWDMKPTKMRSWTRNWWLKQVLAVVHWMKEIRVANDWAGSSFQFDCDMFVNYDSFIDVKLFNKPSSGVSKPKLSSNMTRQFNSINGRNWINNSLNSSRLESSSLVAPKWTRKKVMMNTWNW